MRPFLVILFISLIINSSAQTQFELQKLSSPYFGSVNSITQTPDGTIYTLVNGYGMPGVYRSTDIGENWTQVLPISGGCPSLLPSIKELPYGTKGLILPKDYSLLNNFPNPFNPSTTIRYKIPKTSHINISVYDILGREVEILVDEIKAAGEHQVEFDASGLSSGIYFYTIRAYNFIQTNKMILLK